MDVRSTWRRRLTHSLKGAALSLGCLVFLLALMEGGCYLAIRHPQFLSRSRVLDPVRLLYLNNRDYLQYHERCARWDAELGYTLRPGECIFEAPEFSTSYDINTLGLRDDEDSLSRPGIVVLGDSHAMGWGVEQDETFAQRLEVLLGEKVLNAAISSYGTARELMMLRRLDVSDVRIIILQYCPNDYQENQRFLKVDDLSEISSSEAQYERIVEYLKRQSPYYPGRYLYSGLRIHLWDRFSSRLSGEPSLSSALGPFPRAPTVEEEVEVFRSILEQFAAELPRVPIFLIEVDAYGRRDSSFVVALQERPVSGVDLRIVDLAQAVGKQHFYKLDDHLNGDGHEAIASRLLEVMTD